MAQREHVLAEYRRQPVRGVLLATCDRVEWYGGGGRPSRETASHLFRVAAGLDSPILGENQILGQLRAAYRDASRQTSLDPGLHALFQAALRTGKRVRSETALCRGATGHSLAALRLLEKRFPSGLADLNIMVIGVNKLSRGFLRYLIDHGNRTFLLGNRTLDKAQALVAELGGQAFSLDRIAELLPSADVLLSATAAPHLIVRAGHFAAMPPGSGPRLLIDLAVPRDIDPTLAERPGVELLNVQDLEALMESDRQARLDSVPQAQAIVEEEVARLMADLDRREEHRPAGADR
jgi:glutamyl-tRNA reductase